MAQWSEGSEAGTPGNGAATAANEAAQIEERIEQTVAAAREQVEQAIETAAQFIRERPVLSVAGAVAIGYLVGKLASRR